MPSIVRIATVNVNGIRAAARKGMEGWLATAGVDVLALQEVRATTQQLHDAVGAFVPDWHIVADEAAAKGRAGVALLSPVEPDGVRRGVGGDDADSSGRWLEADFTFGGEHLTVVSAYVHSGEVGTARQDAKWAFLDAMQGRLRELSDASPLSLVVGDLNVAHRELDIRNWKGNVKRAGFLPRERAYLDRFFGPAGDAVTGVDGTTGTGLGWVDVGRRVNGEVDGPYTWWSNRGRAFDNDAGWRIDYHMATPALAGRVRGYRIDRAPSWDTRWSDHAPVVVDYTLG